MKVLIILIIVFLIAIYLFTRKSKFGESPQDKMDDLSDSEPVVSEPVVYIFYASWCGACKKSIKDFLDAEKKSGGKVKANEESQAGVKDLMKKYNITGFPTIIALNGTAYSGDRSTQSIIDFANGL